MMHAGGYSKQNSMLCTDLNLASTAGLTTLIQCVTQHMNLLLFTMTAVTYHCNKPHIP